ncbi:tyrosine--tRNA ligase [Candidatus Woesearchaeota archaeon]|nr:tyrosine--tRNA ligase [Candidatus Woesearchaeota archaeon]
MDTESRLELIKQVGEEIVTEAELKELLQTKTKPVAYDGFEPSGQVHIAQGILRAINVNKMLKAGIHFKMFAADWHAWANNKLEGNLEKIQTCGDYLVEVWKAAGMDVENLEFVRSSDMVAGQEYWKTVINIARAASLKRIVRCGQIMGRKEDEMLSASQIIYPCMQAADIFTLKADITQLGMDQRKVNMLAREVGPKLGLWKPVVVSHHMLMGLGEPKTSIDDPTERAIALKMSKSVPDSAIFMTDTEADIKRKIGKAYCPAKITKENPVMEYAKHIIFEKFKELEIKRPEKFGGDVKIESYENLAKVYSSGELHPADLKSAVAGKINEVVSPVRNHFEKNAKAKKLLEQVKSYKVTR